MQKRPEKSQKSSISSQKDDPIDEWSEGLSEFLDGMFAPPKSDHAPVKKPKRKREDAPHRKYEGDF